MANTNHRFVQDINRIIKVRKEGNGELLSVKVEPIIAVRGIGEVTKPPISHSDGIASPLKEIPGTREYYEPELMTSSDGLFVIEQKVVKRTIFEDANGEQITLEFLK